MKLGVDSSWRDRSAGRELYSSALNEAERRGTMTALLAVKPRNKAAIRLQEDAGLQGRGKRPNPNISCQYGCQPG
jgi:ribosomal protein S18 acetylase RimI-like enzyme